MMEETVIVCAKCTRDMKAEAAPNEQCSMHCPVGDHAHVRCDQCSPRGWFGILAHRVRYEAPKVLNNDETITVCSECLRACCWQGEFMCERARNASTVEKTRKELEKLGIESSHWWDE